MGTSLPLFLTLLVLHVEARTSLRTAGAQHQHQQQYSKHTSTQHQHSITQTSAQDKVPVVDHQKHGSEGLSAAEAHYWQTADLLQVAARTTHRPCRPQQPALADLASAGNSRAAPQSNQEYLVYSCSSSCIPASTGQSAQQNNATTQSAGHRLALLWSGCGRVFTVAQPRMMAGLEGHQQQYHVPALLLVGQAARAAGHHLPASTTAILLLLAWGVLLPRRCT